MAKQETRVILLHSAAPAKPVLGTPCNGCGLCCTAQPCPLGMLLSRRLHGRCGALQWDDGAGRYHCGALVEPGRWLPALPPTLARWLVSRWVAAGIGCDAELEGSR